MKRIFTIIMIGILLVGCAKTDFLIEHDWVHYDTTCIETIYFYLKYIDGKVNLLHFWFTLSVKRSYINQQSSYNNHQNLPMHQ